MDEEQNGALSSSSSAVLLASVPVDTTNSSASGMTRLANIFQEELRNKADSGANVSNNANTSEAIANVLAETQRALREELNAHMAAMTQAHERHMRVLERKLAALLDDKKPAAL